MKSSIPHRLCIIHQNVQENPEDPSFMHCIRLAFEWANNMGMEGKKVFNFQLQKPDPNKYDPLSQQQSLWCRIECTEEERVIWEKIQELNINLAVNTMLKDDDAND